MPSLQQKRRSAVNEHVAREKALRTYVYISGISGHHTLETGLAYYYRGHYIYAYPAGNLIEPIPYSTRKGIVIQGIVSESAPGYNECADALVQEDSIRALEASIAATNNDKERSEENDTTLTASPTDSKTPTSSTTPTPNEPPNPSLRPVSPFPRLLPTSEALPATTISLAALRDLGHNTFTPRPGLTYGAASAPGSRLGSRAASPSGLRPTSSHVGLTRLGAIQEHVGSRSATAVGYLHGLGDHALLGKENLKRFDSGRARPCAIHGDGCDGVAVGSVWKTEEMRLGRGFVEDVPMMDVGGRMMVDWEGLLEEARTEDEQ